MESKDADGARVIQFAAPRGLLAVTVAVVWSCGWMLYASMFIASISHEVPSQLVTVQFSVRSFRTWMVCDVNMLLLFAGSCGGLSRAEWPFRLWCG